MPELPAVSRVETRSEGKSVRLPSPKLDSERGRLLAARDEPPTLSGRPSFWLVCNSFAAPTLPLPLVFSSTDIPLFELLRPSCRREGELPDEIAASSKDRLNEALGMGISTCGACEDVEARFGGSGLDDECDCEAV